jgi:hypothetical protein
MDLIFDHKMRLRPTREGQLLSRGQSIRTLPSTSMDVAPANEKRPSAKKAPRRGLLRIGSSDSISRDENRLLLPSAVVRKQRRGKRRVRESDAAIAHPQERTSPPKPTKVLESNSPTSLTTSMTDESNGLNAAPVIRLSLDEPPSGRGIRLKRRGLVRTYSGDLGHRNDKGFASQPPGRESVTLERQGSVQVGLGDETLMLNVVKVQVNQPPLAPSHGQRRGGLRTTPKGARLARGESIRVQRQ